MNTPLQTIPGVGPAISRELEDLGFTHVEELAEQDPEDMYQRLIKLRERHIDRCVLYVFRCAVYYASTAEHAPEKLKWWNWKDTTGSES